MTRNGDNYSDLSQVLASRDQQDYIPHASARSLLSKKSHTPDRLGGRGTSRSHERHQHLPPARQVPHSSARDEMIISLLCDILEDVEQSKVWQTGSTNVSEHKLLSEIKPFTRFQEIVGKFEKKLSLLKQLRLEVRMS